MTHIHVFGSVNVDIGVTTKTLPREGQTVHGERLDIQGGGKGANQALCAHKLGAPVTLHANVGDDVFNTAALQTLKDHGMNLKHVKTLHGVTTGSAIITRSDQDNRIIVIGGANMKWDNHQIPDHFDADDIVIIQNEIPEALNHLIISRAHESGALIIYDPAPARPINDALYPLIDVITPNESETKALIGITIESVDDAFKALHVFKDKGVRSPIITLGKQGLAYVDATGAPEFLKAENVNTHDTTAAGDAFVGAFASALASKHTFKESLKLASQAAAYTTTIVGAQDAMPSKEALKNTFK